MNQKEKKRKELLASCSGRESLFCDTEHFPASSQRELGSLLRAATTVLPERSGRQAPRGRRSAETTGNHLLLLATRPLLRRPVLSQDFLASWPLLRGHAEQGWPFLLWDPHPGPIKKIHGAPTEAGSAR